MWRAGIVAVAVIACGPRVPHHGPPPTPEQVAALRAEVVAHASSPIENHPEYRIDDAELVDPCVVEALKWIDGMMPDPDERPRIVDDAARCLSWKLRSDDGLARIGKRIADRYAHPVITRAGDRVTIDVGIVACPLQRAPRGAGLLVSSCTGKYELGDWATDEAKRYFKLGIDQFPDAHAYEIDVWLGVGAKDRWRYVFERDYDRVIVEDPTWPDRIVGTGQLGGDPAHAASLRPFDLTAIPK